MRLLFPCLLLLLSCYSALAQRYYPYGIQSRARASLFLGSATYMGDLQEDQSIARTPNAGLSFEYQLTPRWGLRADGMVYRLSASDANSMDPGRQARNLSFFSTNYELSGSVMLFLFRQLPAAYNQRRLLNVYALLGFGGTYFNPKTTYEGKTYALQPLRTEGVSYSRISPVIPAGMGLSARLSKRLDLGMEVTYRTTFTDYLDDVSGNYLAPDQYSSPLAAALGDRRQEKSGGSRGNPALKDGYALYNLRLVYYLNSMYYRATDKKKKLIR